MKKMELHEIESMAASLYDGGWRSEDYQDILDQYWYNMPDSCEEYPKTDDEKELAANECSDVCEKLEEFFRDQVAKAVDEFNSNAKVPGWNSEMIYDRNTEKISVDYISVSDLTKYKPGIVRIWPLLDPERRRLGTLELDDWVEAVKKASMTSFLSSTT
jgi:hypothetical protein